MLVKASLALFVALSLLTVQAGFSQLKSKEQAKEQANEQAKAKENTPPPNEEKAALAESRLVIKNGKHFFGSRYARNDIGKRKRRIWTLRR